MVDEPDEPELLDLARGDAGQARLLHEAIRHLAEEDGQPDLQELAQGVLDGRTTLRQAMLSSAYSDVLRERFDAFAGWYQNLSPEEREAQETAGREQLDRLRQLTDRAADGPRQPPSR